MGRRKIYYLTGVGGQLDAGLGLALSKRGFDVVGRESRGKFAALPFQEKLDLIRADMEADFCHPDALVICNSFGGYLFLHTVAEMGSFPGRVLLLSPIVGHFVNEERFMSFVPPRSSRLMEHAKSGKFPRLHRAEIHVGDADWQSHPAAVGEFAAAINVPLKIVEGKGHALGADYLEPVLDRWLIDR